MKTEAVMTDIATLRDLLARCEGATGPDRQTDYRMRMVLIDGYSCTDIDRMFSDLASDVIDGDENGDPPSPAFTSSIDAAVALIERVLPGWWHTSGLCALSGHASIGPDYNGPDRARLLREFPIEKFDGKFDADLKPGDGAHRQCLALLHCLLQALILIHQEAQRAPGDAMGEVSHD